MENLMDAMVSVLSQVPDDPKMPEWIGIQSKGMKQWISTKMAAHLGICANVHFLFPRQIVDQILISSPPPENQRVILDQPYGLTEDVLFWSVMKQINAHRSRKEEWSRIDPYIKEDETGRKRYQLSLIIAKLFDDYQVYRPDMLVGWQSEQTADADWLTDPAAQWQAALWRTLVGKEFKHHLAVSVEHFLKHFSLKEMITGALPSRVSLFGLSALPESFLQVFEKMSEIMDVNLFLLTPSNQFFFDIKSEREMGKLAIEEKIDPGQFYYEMTNPLLSSLGTVGKKFHSRIEAFDYNEPLDDLFQDPLDENQTLLSYLQSDILNLVHRKEGKDQVPVHIRAADTTVSIHACHSPMREAQVLKDLLLNEFEKDPGLMPHDVIVMMPDIEAYAPFIESAFTLEKTLPFSISDRRKKSESEPLEAFLKILELKNTRLEQSRVIELLLSETIAKKFHVTTDEISMIEKMVEDAHILWGRDADHREALSLPPFEENTWQFGLQRLFLGMAMPEEWVVPVKGILPCASFEGLDLDVLGKLAAFCHAVFDSLEIMDKKKSVGQWCHALKKIISILMNRNYTNGEDISFLIRTIDQAFESSRAAGFRDVISFEVMRSLIENKLDLNISQGNFLTGGITFCNIMPMRSIPFKIVVLMGMNETSFPRQTFAPAFNLMKKYPKPGDKIDRDDDRYLFLEILLSARSKFLITYTGMSLQDNSVLPCSGVVSELLDIMDQSFIFQQGAACHLFHPLHPFNKDYFNPTRPFFSFSKDNLTIAAALAKNSAERMNSNKGVSTSSLFIQAPSKKAVENIQVSIPLDEIIRFFKNPLEVFMKEGLNIQFKNMVEQARDREVFSVSGLDQYGMGSFLVESRMNSNYPADFYPTLKAAGALPLGEKGNLEYQRIVDSAGPVIDAAKRLLCKEKLPAISPEIQMGGKTLSCHFPDIREDGVYYVSYGKLNGARLLSGWIRHLFFNLCNPSDYPGTTHLIGRDPKGKQPVSVCVFPPMGSVDARTHFKRLLEVYQNGRSAPFYFFCETAWEFVRILKKNKFELTRKIVFKAMNHSAIKTRWYGGYTQSGEKENRYISLCVENNDPFDNVDTLLSSGFVENTVTVYKPLLENMENLS